nr:histone h1 [Quercus suber]
MAPKKAAAAPAKKSAGSAPAHSSYQDMIKEAIISLKDIKGSSRQAIKKYVQANNNLASVSDAAFTTLFNKAIQRGTDTGVFARPKDPRSSGFDPSTFPSRTLLTSPLFTGTSGTVKLAGPTKAATAAGKPATKSATASKPAKAKTVKATTTKKAPAKKATAAKPATKKAPAKKTTTKTKANTGKARKASTDAPAVVDKAPVVLGKTKSGRVTKSKAPQPEKKAASKAKAPAKKAAPKKAAAAKKA